MEKSRVGMVKKVDEEKLQVYQICTLLQKVSCLCEILLKLESGSQIKRTPQIDLLKTIKEKSKEY